MSSFLKDLYTAATDLAKDATDFALNKTDLEKKLDEVLSDKNYGTPTSALREIAAATSYQYVILLLHLLLHLLYLLIIILLPFLYLFFPKQC